MNGYLVLAGVIWLTIIWQAATLFIETIREFK